MKEALTNLLKPMAEKMFAMIVSVPLPAVRFLFLGLLLVLAIWLLTLPRMRAAGENGKPKSWITDLRVMGIGLLALQSLCYIFL